jgi:hypothetical protein
MFLSLDFDASKLPSAESEYVAWVDVMGTQMAMSRSIKITANFIFKLHMAAIRSFSDAVKLYPVMDGFYVAAKKQADMLTFLRNVYRQVADEFVSTTKSQHRFMIRGGLAFGPVIHGDNVGGCSRELKEESSYANQILLGVPMVQAHLCERDAPPFGIFVHESARSFAPEGSDSLHWIWWRWDNAESKATWSHLAVKLKDHFVWCKERAQAIGYPVDRIEAHRLMVEQYFQD